LRCSHRLRPRLPRPLLGNKGHDHRHRVRLQQPEPSLRVLDAALGVERLQLCSRYSTSASFAWNSTGALAGSETFGVWVRDAASQGIACNVGQGCYDAFVPLPYTVTAGATCTAVTENRGTGLFGVVGHSVIFTASAASCPNPRYEFWMRPASQTNWQLVQGYSTSATYNWNSTGAAAASCISGVGARRQQQRSPGRLQQHRLHRDGRIVMRIRDRLRGA